MPKRETSPEISSLAASLLGRKPAIGVPRHQLSEQGNPDDRYISLEAYNALLKEAQKVAGSAWSQDETKGQD